MNIGIAGLGTIGGSLARAFYHTANYSVLGWDNDVYTMQRAQMIHTLDVILIDSNIGKCKVILLIMSPEETRDYLEKNGRFIKSDTLVIDCALANRSVYELGCSMARQYGFTFLAGRPLIEVAEEGFRSSRPDLFAGASMLLVPENPSDEALIAHVQTLFTSVGFAGLTLSTLEEAGIQ